MSEEQLTALLAKLRDDAELREKLKGAADLDAAVAIAKEGGFDVTKADWLRHQAKQTLTLSDKELESVAGGAGSAKCLTEPYQCDSIVVEFCRGGEVTWNDMDYQVC